MAVLKGIDRPLDASEEGLVEFSTGLSNEQRRKFKMAIIDASLVDIENVARFHLGANAVSCVVGEPIVHE